MELILYTALVSIFITAAVYFAWDVVYGRIRSQVQQEVTENARLCIQRIQAEIRNADDIITVNPNSLELNSGDLGTTTIFLENQAVKITQQGSTVVLTSDQVEVTELNFIDHSSGDGDSKNIEFSLRISYKNPEGKKEWAKTVSFQSSAEIRSN